MVLIAVDPHKSSHTAVAVDERGAELDRLRVEAREPGRLLRWARRWPERRWAIEGASGLGRPLAQRLLAEGESVVDVPPALVARVRLLSGPGHKTDQADATATALAALRAPALRAVAEEDERTVLRLLSDRRDDLTGERTRVVNRLHAQLRDLRAGGAPRRLTARRAAALLRTLRPRTAVAVERKRLARELLAELRTLDRRLVDNRSRIEALLAQQRTSLTALPGVGPVVAAKLIGRSGRMERFPSRHHYASYTGTAPLEASSGEVVRHRLNRRGDRQLNQALHVVALTQVRHRGTPGHTYYQRKRSEGKSGREALRCLKRRLADVVYRHLVADQNVSRAAA